VGQGGEPGVERGVTGEPLASPVRQAGLLRRRLPQPPPAQGLHLHGTDLESVDKYKASRGG
jgi:hypothetical protein